MPKPMKRLDREIEHSGNWLPTRSAEEQFEVEHTAFVNRFVVDLSKRTCSCNYWQLIGIPCRHAIAGMSYKGYKPMDYVDECYSREKYLECYDHGISPINGQNMWPTIWEEEMLPPQYKRGPGRPKKLRRREFDEDPNATNLKRQNTKYRCTECNKLGHNARGCKSTEVSAEAQSGKRKPKKQRTDAVPDAAAEQVPDVAAQQVPDAAASVHIAAAPVVDSAAPVHIAAAPVVDSAAPVHIAAKVTGRSKQLGIRRKLPIKKGSAPSVTAVTPTAPRVIAVAPTAPRVIAVAATAHSSNAAADYGGDLTKESGRKKKRGVGVGRGEGLGNGGRGRRRPVVGRRQVLSRRYVFLPHSSLLHPRFPHPTPLPPPPRPFHWIHRFSPRRRRQRGCGSPRLFSIFRCFSQGRPCRPSRCLHCFLRSFSLPIKKPSLSPSPPRHFPCLISFIPLLLFYKSIEEK